MTPRRRRLFSLPWRTARQIRRDVDDELRFHLDMRIDALVALGLSPDEARARALREFGDIDDARHYMGTMDRGSEAARRRSEYMHELRQDIVYALRKLRGTPAFTLAAVATLALGIGANTAIFSVVNAVLLRPLPFPQADRLVRVAYTQQGHGDAGTPSDLETFRSRATASFVGFSVIEGTTANVVRDGADAERVAGARVSANHFDLLRVAPLAGRFFAAGDDEASAPNTAVISEHLWNTRFGGDQSIVGKTIRINSTPFTIVGVVGDAVRYPMTVDLWMTKRFSASDLQARGARWLSMLARVKDDASLVSANAELEHVMTAVEKQYPKVFLERRAHVVPVQEFLVGDMRKPLLIILGAVGLVLLIACANVANLMLVRAASRESEMAIRTALGAERGRLARQLITESLVVTVCGGALGLAVASLGMRMLLARAPQSLFALGRASLDSTTLIVTAILALVTGVVFGALPAFQIGSERLAFSLRAGGRGIRARPSANRARRLIVVAEVALAVTLLTSAGLLLHSFVKLLSVDPGFRPEGVISMRAVLPGRAYDSTAIRSFVTAFEDRVKAMPGVTAVGISNSIPLDGSSYGFTFSIRGRPPAGPNDEPSAEVRVVTPAFFQALGTPVLRGRGITTADRPGAEKVFVVNQAFVKRFFPNSDAVGQAISLGWGEDSTGEIRRIVGVVGDVRSSALADAPEPTIYASMTQSPHMSLAILIRTTRDPTSLVAPLRGIVRDLDREVPVFSVQTMEDRLVSSVGTERFYATLIAVFAALALVLSSVGLYGVVAYAVSQRMHELGVRVALGATASGITRMVVGEGLALTAFGTLVGIVASVGAGKLLATLLFGVDAFDPATFAAVVVVLALVAAMASWLPARRAARADPLAVIRGE